MPDETVTDDEHLVLLAEGDIAVSRLPVVLVGLRMDELPLQIVFRGDRAEMLLGDGCRVGILAVTTLRFTAPPIRKSFLNVSLSVTSFF